MPHPPSNARRRRCRDSIQCAISYNCSTRQTRCQNPSCPLLWRLWRALRRPLSRAALATLRKFCEFLGIFLNGERFGVRPAVSFLGRRRLPPCRRNLTHLHSAHTHLKWPTTGMNSSRPSFARDLSKRRIASAPLRSAFFAIGDLWAIRSGSPPTPLSHTPLPLLPRRPIPNGNTHSELAAPNTLGPSAARSAISLWPPPTFILYTDAASTARIISAVPFRPSDMPHLRGLLVRYANFLAQKVPRYQSNPRP